tara:strand:- start:988 stop:1671 length:684 start_codon:yes stop_codon:yes gene_type:complete
MESIQFKKKVILILLLAGVINSSAQEIILIDFGPNDVVNGNVTNVIDVNGDYWNNMTDSKSGSQIVLSDISNNSEGATLKLNISMGKNGINNGGLLEPSEEHLGKIAIATATQDYFYINGDSHASISLVGLDVNKEYRFSIFGSRNTQLARESFYAIRGENISSGILQTSGIPPNNESDLYHGNDTSVFTSQYVNPLKDGTIDVQVRIEKGGFAYMNAMKIEIKNTK